MLFFKHSNINDRRTWGLRNKGSKLYVNKLPAKFRGLAVARDLFWTGGCYNQIRHLARNASSGANAGA